MQVDFVRSGLGWLGGSIGLHTRWGEELAEITEGNSHRFTLPSAFRRGQDRWLLTLQPIGAPCNYSDPNCDRWNSNITANATAIQRQIICTEQAVIWSERPLYANGTRVDVPATTNTYRFNLTVPPGVDALGLYCTLYVSGVAQTCYNVLALQANSSFEVYGSTALGLPLYGSHDHTNATWMIELTGIPVFGSVYAVFFPAPTPALVPYNVWNSFAFPLPTFALSCDIAEHDCGVLFFNQLFVDMDATWSAGSSLTELVSDNPIDPSSGAFLITCGAPRMYAQYEQDNSNYADSLNVSVSSQRLERIPVVPGSTATFLLRKTDKLRLFQFDNAPNVNTIVFFPNVPPQFNNSSSCTFTANNPGSYSVVSNATIYGQYFLALTNFSATLTLSGITNDVNFSVVFPPTFPVTFSNGSTALLDLGIGSSVINIEHHDRLVDTMAGNDCFLLNCFLTFICQVFTSMNGMSLCLRISSFPPPCSF